MKRQWLLLSAVSVVCLCVWLMVFSFIQYHQSGSEKAIEVTETDEDNHSDSIEYSINETNNETVLTSDTKDKDKNFELEKENVHKLNKNTHDFKTKGIQAGDFSDIAPDNIISIEDVIARVFSHSSNE